MRENGKKSPTPQAEIEARQAERFKRATVGAVRAMGGQAQTEVSFLNGPVPSGVSVTGSHVRLPHPSRRMTDAEMTRMRGAADAAALRLRHHDTGLHDRARPPAGEAREVYDTLEQARVESLGARHMAGVAANLDARLAQECADLGLDRLPSHTRLPTPVALGLLARARMSGQPVVESMRDLMTRWHDDLPPAARRALDEMASRQDSQADFAQAARRLLMACSLLEQETTPDEAADDGTTEAESASSEDEEQGEDATPEPQDEGPEEEDSSQPMQMSQGTGAGDDEPEDGEQGGTASGSEEAGGPGEESPEQEGTLPAYRAFTTVYDEEIAAEDLCDAEELFRLRQTLDQQLVSMQGVVSKLANRLQRKLMAQQTRAWEFDLEEGMLDAGRLSRIVVNPMLSLSYKRERDTDFRDTVVTLLIDNSGSMRGRPISVAAMCGDILARTLERCAVKVEVLGFTTRAWKGGRSREAWSQAGKPENPGRLNDLRHIVYKAADMPWRRARRNLGLMLREGLLKENIDGEALLWAQRRLAGRAEVRRILMVISDGAPVDDSTLSANPGSYLENHLREVIAHIETRTSTELLAIGIGHDVTRYYRRAVTITDPEELGGTMMKKLSELFAEEAATKPRRGG
ncbi:cobaltochelatase CobT-related protein [Komagataeibacter sp. FNDCF1]|uniref:cobaltochelatase CobT-related protein n=1 Tax=Komagataeibacter sp. FNDCF1 TaxID=2878681 RepID=UPI001E3F5977|nr:cobaltochelatase subunit CobT [Komagataeibacter sp. FNDCF1]MCE2563840.1 cobaltochelatase subunit CobT [Komagataeibacter sp. FNDCF1]